MEIKNFINKKSALLNQFARELKQVVINWQTPIIVDCNSLDSTRASTLISQHPALSEGKSFPGVYYFKILNGIDGQTIVKALKTYKLQKTRSCPKIEDKRSKDSIYLYCGSVKGGKVDIKGRLIQHLGFSNKDTYSLQLIHWAKELNLLLEFNYSFLKVNQKRLTELVESSLSTALKPLVGKIAN